MVFSNTHRPTEGSRALWRSAYCSKVGAGKKSGTVPITFCDVRKSVQRDGDLLKNSGANSKEFLNIKVENLNKQNNDNWILTHRTEYQVHTDIKMN